MPSLEDKLKQKRQEEQQQERARQSAQAAKEAEEARRRQAHRAIFSPYVQEALDEFPRLARKYGMPTSEIVYIAAGFLGLGQGQRKRAKVWSLPFEVCLAPNGSFYRYDRYAQTNYSVWPISIFAKIERAEAIEKICDGCRMATDPKPSPQAIRDYVQDLFIACLEKRK